MVGHIDELKLELEELLLEDAPIEITGFSNAEIDQIVSGEELTGIEEGVLTPGCKSCCTDWGRLCHGRAPPYLRRFD
jgi:hypothetical protein